MLLLSVWIATNVEYLGSKVIENITYFGSGEPAAVPLGLFLMLGILAQFLKMSIQIKKSLKISK